MDSPFARLTELMVELVDEQKVPIPKAFMRVALGMMRRSVRKRAGFNIDDVAPLNRVSQCHIPALFGKPSMAATRPEKCRSNSCWGDEESAWTSRCSY